MEFGLLTCNYRCLYCYFQTILRTSWPCVFNSCLPDSTGMSGCSPLFCPDNLCCTRKVCNNACVVGSAVLSRKHPFSLKASFFFLESKYRTLPGSAKKVLCFLKCRPVCVNVLWGDNQKYFHPSCFLRFLHTFYNPFVTLTCFRSWNKF